MHFEKSKNLLESGKVQWGNFTSPKENSIAQSPQTIISNPEDSEHICSSDIYNVMEKNVRHVNYCKCDSYVYDQQQQQQQQEEEEEEEWRHHITKESEHAKATPFYNTSTLTKNNHSLNETESHRPSRNSWGEHEYTPYMGKEKQSIGTRSSDSTSYKRRKRINKQMSKKSKLDSDEQKLEYELLLQTSFPSAYTSGYVIEEEDMTEDDLPTVVQNRKKSKVGKHKRVSKNDDSIEYSFEFQSDDSDNEDYFETSNLYRESGSKIERANRNCTNCHNSHTSASPYVTKQPFKLSSLKTLSSSSSTTSSSFSSSSSSSLNLKSLTREYESQNITPNWNKKKTQKYRNNSATNTTTSNIKEEEELLERTNRTNKHNNHDVDRIMANKKIRKKLQRQNSLCEMTGHVQTCNKVKGTRGEYKLHLTSDDVQELFASHNQRCKIKYKQDNEHGVMCEKDKIHTANIDEDLTMSESKHKWEKGNNCNASNDAQSHELAQYFISPVHQCVAQATSPWSADLTQEVNKSETRYEFIGFGGIADTTLPKRDEVTTETKCDVVLSSCNDSKTNVTNVSALTEHCNVNNLLSANQYHHTNRERSYKSPIMKQESESVSKNSHVKIKQHKKCKRAHREHNKYEDVISEIEISWEGKSWSSETDSYEMPRNTHYHERKRRRLNWHGNDHDFVATSHKCRTKDKRSLVDDECGGSKMLAPHPPPPMVLPPASLPCSTFTLNEEVIPVSMELTSLSLGDSNDVDNVHIIF